MHTKTKPINTCILEISSQNKAILDFFFASGGESLFKESRRDDAAAFMVDYDFPRAKESWDTVYQSTKKPAIIFSINKVELPSTIWVPKPLTAKALTNAGVELRELIDSLEMESIEEVSKEEQIEPEIQALSEKVESSNVIESVERIPESFADVELDNDSKEKKSSYEDVVLSNKVKIENDLFTESTEDVDELDQLLKSIESDGFFDSTKTENKDSIEINALTSNHDVTSTSDEIETTEEKEAVITPKSLEEMPAEPEVDIFGIPVVNNVVSKKVVTEITTEPNGENSVNEINEDEETAEKPASLLSGEPNWNETDDELDQLLKSIEDEFDTVSNKETISDPLPKTKKAPITAAAERWEMLCGNYEDVKAEEINTLFFNTKDYFFNFVLTTIKQAKIEQTVLHVQYYDISITIDPILDLIYSSPSIKSDSFSLFCFKPLKHAEIKKQTVGSEEIKLARKKMGTEPENTCSFEAFIWTTSMLTSKGRLPQTTDIKKIVSIKHWPDLTRMEQIPHAIRIAAVFYKHPGTLIEIASWLKIPQSYVFAFYNAALALEMVEHKTVQTEEQHYFQMEMTEIEGEVEKPKNRGLFSRLLNKLAA